MPVFYRVLSNGNRTRASLSNSAYGFDSLVEVWKRFAWDCDISQLVDSNDGDNSHSKRARVEEVTNSAIESDQEIVDLYDWNHVCLVAAARRSVSEAMGDEEDTVCLPIEVAGLLSPADCLAQTQSKCFNDLHRKKPVLRVPSVLGTYRNPTVVQVAAGYRHVLVLVAWELTCTLVSPSHPPLSSSSSRTTRVYAMGCGSSGELGVGRRLDWTDDFVPVDFTEEVRYIAAGDSCSALIAASSNQVFTFGCGAYFRLGHGDDIDRLSPSWVTSLDTVGQISPSGTFAGVKSVACGRWHMVAVSAGLEEVYGWGWNRFGQLGSIGHGSEHAVLREPQRLSELDAAHLLGAYEDGASISVRQILCGARFTALLTDRGSRVIIIGSLGNKDDDNDEVNATDDDPTEPRALISELQESSVTVSRLYASLWALVAEEKVPN